MDEDGNLNYDDSYVLTGAKLEELGIMTDEIEIMREDPKNSHIINLHYVKLSSILKNRSEDLGDFEEIY